MIKYTHNSVAYYFTEQRHLGQALESLERHAEPTSFALMALAHFAVCQITNQLLKNRYASLERLLDDHYHPEVAN